MPGALASAETPLRPMHFKGRPAYARPFALNRYIVSSTNKQVGRQTDKLMDRQRVSHTDRQIDRCLCVCPVHLTVLSVPQAVTSVFFLSNDFLHTATCPSVSAMGPRTRKSRHGHSSAVQSADPPDGSTMHVLNTM